MEVMSGSVEDGRVVEAILVASFTQNLEVFTAWRFRWLEMAHD
jgi:hypothetical protein